MAKVELRLSQGVDGRAGSGVAPAELTSQIHT